MAAADVLALVALVVVLAVAAEMVGDRVGVPNFVFFILAGLVVGPPGLGWIDHEVFGKGLGVVVGLSVAVILFHSGAGITVPELRQAPASVFRMAVGGVVVTFVGMTAAVFLLLNVPLGVALLIGALLVATGTTVIEPLLAAVPVHEDLASALDIEATITEVAAGVLSVAVFHGVTLGEPESSEFAATFAWVLAVGVVVGAVGAAVAWLAFTVPERAPRRAPRHASQLYLATALVTYAVAESIALEAGVAAAATAGVVLGNADLPFEEHIATVEEDLTTFIIAFLFVVLASFVEPEWLATVGVAGLVVGLALILVVRPLAVFLSTAGSTLSVREKLFLSSASPRGIIPAGVATLLAIEIQDQTPEIAVTITGTVLLVILVSATFEGLVAGRVVNHFGLTTDQTVVVGGGRFGLPLAERYERDGDQVIVVERDAETVERDRSAGYAVYHGDGTDPAVLEEAGVDRATRVVAATDDDETNREIARIVVERFDVGTVAARLNRLDDRSLFADLDVELFTASHLDRWALESVVDESAPDWLGKLATEGGLGSVTIPPDVTTTVADLDRSLPDRAFVVAACRDGETWIPEREDAVRGGDRLTLLGESSAVEEALDWLATPAGERDTGSPTEEPAGGATRDGRETSDDDGRR